MTVPASAAPRRGEWVDDLLGVSAPMAAVRGQLRVAARGRSPVLLVGESGTGKELAATALHHQSPRAQSPFVSVNCAAIPCELFESELFGHERGAFTGATRDRVGLFEQADGGTLFLDELEALSLPHQSKLLRVLEDGEARRIGGAACRFDVRLLAATNVEPVELVRTQQLREDLYHRLRGFEILLPPLTERLEDVPVLARHFLRRHDADADRELLVSLSSLPWGSELRWRGNVRLLRHLVTTALDHSSSGTVTNVELRAALSSLRLTPTTVCPTRSADTGARSTHAARPGVEAVKIAEVVRCLRACDGRVGQAAAALGVHRSTLRRWMRKYGIHAATEGAEPRSRDALRA